MRRTHIAAIIITLVVASFMVAACDDEEDDGSDRTPPAQATATTPAAPTAAPTAPSEVQLTDDDNGATVSLAASGTLIVALASNPSTGFGWSVAEGSGTALTLSGEPTYVPPGSTSPVVGAAGTQVFTFNAGDINATVDLTLEYKRSFEPGVPPEKTFTVTVEIE